MWYTGRDVGEEWEPQRGKQGEDSAVCFSPTLQPGAS